MEPIICDRTVEHPIVDKFFYTTNQEITKRLYNYFIIKFGVNIYWAAFKKPIAFYYYFNQNEKIKFFEIKEHIRHIIYDHYINILYDVFKEFAPKNSTLKDLIRFYYLQERKKFYDDRDRDEFRKKLEQKARLEYGPLYTVEVLEDA